MAVANFHYITRMSSGFKVYILEGQSHLRSEDRFRHITSERTRVPTVYPIKRKRSHDRGLTLEERRERALNRSGGGKAVQTAATASIHTSQSPTSTWSPTASPISPPATHAYYPPVMDQPIALIKKPRKETDSVEEKTKSPASPPIQVRPSVITCVSSLRNPSCRSEVHRGHPPVISKCNYDHVVEEHFQRSLGLDYQKARSQLSISVSVDDHFAKALGDKWLQIKSKSSSCSSTPPSSPSVTHSPTYSHSQNQFHKEPTSSSSTNCSHWAGN